MSWIYFVDIIGTCVFAISGVVTAIHKKFDLVGSLIIGFVTAIGGGTIRDILIGRHPVGWLNDRNYFIAICGGYLIAYFFKSKVEQFRKGMFLFDTVGIGLFTILGIDIAKSYELNIEVCLTMGVISACFGGVLRDVLTNEVPLIFRKEIYASACLAGGIVYLFLNYYLPFQHLNMLISMASVMLIRYLAVKKSWALNINTP